MMTLSLALGEPGTCIMTSVWNETASRYDLRIDHADPQVWITDVLLDEVANARTPHADYRCPHRECCHCDEKPDGVRYVGDVVAIRGVNRTVVYRIMRHLPERHVYEMEWPD